MFSLGMRDGYRNAGEKAQRRASGALMPRVGRSLRGATHFANVTSGVKSSRRVRRAKPLSSNVSSRSQATLLAQ